MAALHSLYDQHRAHPVSTLVAAQLANWYMEQGDEYKPLAPAHKGDYRKALAIAEAAIKDHPDSEGAGACKAVIRRLRHKILYLSLEEVHLPEQPFRMLVEYRNLSHLYFRVIRVDQQFKERMQKLRYGHENQAQLAAMLRDQEVTHAWSQPLTEEMTSDLHRHRLEVKVPALKPGEYAVLAADTKDFAYTQHAIAYAFTQVSGISYFTQNRDDKTHVYVRNRESGKP